MVSQNEVVGKPGPTIRRGQSRQDYQTPSDFIEAFVRRFGRIGFDLAADKTNALATCYFSVEDNSLIQPWHKILGALWLNPPFDDITPWARKCAEESQLGAHVFFLVPASIGSNWFRMWVQPFAYVFALNPRLTFVGCTTPYPKDLMLACYTNGYVGFNTWRWKK